MAYMNSMFLFGRKLTIAGLGLSLIISAGCRSHKPAVIVPPPAEAVAGAPGQTNKVRLPPDSGDNMAPNILSWDATDKTYEAKPGDLVAPFMFTLTNVSSEPLVIYDTSTTCDCTVAKLPSKPWVVPSGGTGQILAAIHIQYKKGPVMTQIIVYTSRGNRRLTVRAMLPKEK